MRVITLLYICLHCVWPVLSGTIETSQYGFKNLFGHSRQKELVPGTKEEKAGGTWINRMPEALRDMLNALEVMQDSYFDIFTGTWPDAIDWTAAVVGTHISATLASIVSSLDASTLSTCSDMLSWQNIIDRYYSHTTVFYFGENAFALRNQAYDDMLWVVLGWIENLKFAQMYSLKHWDFIQSGRRPDSDIGWHGLQISPMAAHRARIFYDLASAGWDESLCGGGMTWNPYLTPYKNAITNELFASASIAMYLYHPGDNNTSPYLAQGSDGLAKPHNPLYLENAIKSYKWLMRSHMRSWYSGLYQDGFHVRDWHRYPNGTINPGTGKCDELDRMVYTYNQGVVLSASRGLWLATGAGSYLDDGHTLVDNVIRATGWPSNDLMWRGLGRAGILEEFCDHRGWCSQDGQTFKGIFFHHLSEFCRPLWPQEEAFISSGKSASFDRKIYQYHLARCAAYDKWIVHNANAANATRDSDGHFGMWWTIGKPNRDTMAVIQQSTVLSPGTHDYRNPVPEDWSTQSMNSTDWNDRGRGRTVETQSGGLSVLRARWNWQQHLRQA